MSHYRRSSTRIVATYCSGTIRLQVPRKHRTKVREVLAPLSVRLIRPRERADGRFRAVAEEVALTDAALLNTTLAESALSDQANLYLDEGGEPVYALGLDDAVVTLLQQAGYAVSRSVVPCESILPLRRPTLESDAAIDPRIPWFVRNTFRGRIRIAAGVQLVDLLAGIIAAFPTARIAIVTEHRHTAAAIGEELCERFRNERIGLVLDPGRRDNGERIWIGRLFWSGALAVETFPLVLVIDSRMLLRARNDGCMFFHGARVIAIEHAQASYSDSEQRLLARWLGFENLTVRDLRLQQRSTAVICQPTTIAPAFTKTDNPYATYRDGVVQNSQFNNLVSVIAGFFACTGAPHAPRRIEPELVAAKSRLHGNHVIVVVELVEHAIELANLLTTAKLRFGSGVDLADLDLPDLRRRLWNGCGSPPLTIATTAALSSVNPADYDVLIMATARPELPDCLWRFAYTTLDHAATPLLVVDFVDSRAGSREQQSLTRLCEYSRQTQWQIATLSQTVVALQNLRRPRRRRRAKPCP